MKKKSRLWVPTSWQKGGLQPAQLLEGLQLAHLLQEFYLPFPAFLQAFSHMVEGEATRRLTSVAGQLTSVGREAPVVNFIPSLTEIIIVLGIFGLCAALYMIGNRFLPLSEHEPRR